jgi:cytochrome P450
MNPVKATLSQLAPVPPHVLSGLVRDVDVYDLTEPGIDPQEGWFGVQQANPDIFWTPRNGGHWIVTRAELLDKIVNDPGHFSSRYLTVPKDDGPLTFIAMDPPEHTPLRRAIQPFFAKGLVDKIEAEARKAAINTIEKLMPRGQCEFIEEFARVLPVVVFLDMMGLPQEDRVMLLAPAHVITRSADPHERTTARYELSNYMSKWIELRAAEPGDDLVSNLLKSEIDDRRIAHDEALQILNLLLLGGLDTVASMLGFIALDLAQQPGLRKRLIEDPAIVSTAVEEFIRRHGLANPVRLIKQDISFAGVELKRGELIMMPNCLHGLDNRRHTDPLTIDFDRPRPIRHSAFSGGPHMCPGAMLARREIKVFLEEWLKALPEFAIRPGTVPVTAAGAVNGVIELHLMWEPRG